MVEEGVSIHTDTSGSGLTVKATETVHSTQIAQSGSDSDKGAVAASAVYAGHESTTVAQVDAGAIIDGGALNITSSSDVITEAVTGGFSWGPIGIGMSGGVVNVNRHTGAFTGRRKWSDEYADELPYGSAAGVDLPAALGALTVAGLDVAAENKGVSGNFSIVGAGSKGRKAKNPAGEMGGLDEAAMTVELVLEGIGRRPKECCRKRPGTTYDDALGDKEQAILTRLRRRKLRLPSPVTPP